MSSSASDSGGIDRARKKLKKRLQIQDERLLAQRHKIPSLRSLSNQDDMKRSVSIVKEPQSQEVLDILQRLKQR